MRTKIADLMPGYDAAPKSTRVSGETTDFLMICGSLDGEAGERGA